MYALSLISLKLTGWLQWVCWGDTFVVLLNDYRVLTHFPLLAATDICGSQISARFLLLLTHTHTLMHTLPQCIAWSCRSMTIPLQVGHYHSSLCIMCALVLVGAEYLKVNSFKCRTKNWTIRKRIPCCRLWPCSKNSLRKLYFANIRGKRTCNPLVSETCSVRLSYMFLSTHKIPRCRLFIFHFYLLEITRHVFQISNLLGYDTINFLLVKKVSSPTDQPLRNLSASKSVDQCFCAT